MAFLTPKFSLSRLRVPISKKCSSRWKILTHWNHASSIAALRVSEAAKQETAVLKAVLEVVEEVVLALVAVVGSGQCE